MPTLNIEGLGSVSVGDDFLKLSPEDQHNTVDEIFASAKQSMGGAPKVDDTSPAAMAAKPHPPTYLGESGEALNKAQLEQLYARKAPDESIGSAFANALQPNTPLGLSPETKAQIPTKEGVAIAQGIAIPADAATRGVGAVVAAGGQALKQGAEAFGMSPTWAQRLENEAVNLAGSEGVRAGMQPSPGALAPKGLSAIAPELAGPTEGQAVAAAGQRIGVDVPKAAASDTTAVQQLGKVVTNIPIAGTPLRKASEKAIGKLDEAAKNVEQGYGGASVPAAGEAARDSLTEYVSGTTKARQQKLYDKVDELVDPNMTVSLPATSRMASLISGERTAGALKPSGAVGMVQDALSRPEGLTYQGIKKLRTSVGEMLDGHSPLPAETSQAELKRIYGSLTQDLGNTIKASGNQEALNAFGRANTYTRLVSDRRQNLMRVLGAKNDEGIISRLMAAAGSTSTADTKLLQQVRHSIDPETADGIASAVVSKLGRGPDGVFSPDRFVPAWGKITPPAKSILFKSTGKGELARALDDIATVSTRFKQLQKFANPSGTGQTVTGYAELHGMFVAPLTTLSVITSGRVVSHLLARPATATATANWAKSYMAVMQTKSAAALNAYRRNASILATTIGNELGTLQVIPRLTMELQGATPSQAQPDQGH